MIDYTPLIRWGAIAVFVALAFGGVSKCSYTAGRDKVQGQLDAAKAQHAAVIADLAAKTKQAADKAHAASDALKTERANLDARHNEALTHANREADHLRADLRSGAVRLQDRWTCDLPGTGQGAAAAGAGAADPQGRYDSAADLVRAADEDAAVIGWLWNLWMADRRAVIEAGCAVEAR